MKKIIGLAALLVVAFSSVSAAEQQATGEKELLRIFSENKNDVKYKVGEGDDAIIVTRTMTSCAKNKGWLQELIPSPGVHPVTELEILKAMNDKDAMIIDMRQQDHFVEGTVPKAINIPYTEVSLRLDELGCEKTAGKWQCDNAKKVYGFCNGPVCPQSPIAMKAMVREGFPADKIYYYRGGMLDWEALGLTTVEGEF